MFYDRFEKTWDRYLKRHSTNIKLTGIKKSIMSEPPVFNITGAFSGWSDNDEKKDILAELGTVVKLKISDLKNTYSQPNIMKGNGKPVKALILTQLKNNILYSETELNKSYKINISIRGNNFKRVLKIYDEQNNNYNKVILNKDKEFSINIVSIGNKLYIDYSEGVGDIDCNVNINLLDESIPCPITNLKSEIDFLTANGRSFKIDNQELSGSGNLMILTLSNMG